MDQNIKVLIIEDEPLIVDAYQRALKILTHDEDLKFSVEIADNCDLAISKLNMAKTSGGIDIVLLDIRLPHTRESNILCGEDLGIKLKNTFRNIKIIVSTSYSDSYRISSILKNVNPDGFLVKSDLTMNTLVDGINTVISKRPFYSQKVIQMFRKQSSNDLFVDNIDRKLLYELSNGTKMNELPDVLPLSIASLERRKRILKDVFNVAGKGDRELLLIAREKGFI